MGKMVVVESPAKARTIGKYLGKDFVVKACAGHIKDLPKNRLGVDIEKEFAPTYTVIAGKEKIVTELRKAARSSQDIYLAADPDREGEAICQHLAEELNGGRGRRIHRVLFNEITKQAILQAFEHPGSIDSNKVNAQQARRVLDRLVGYQVSPLLWKGIQRGLSAGRVQSVALRMIVDREREIRAFVSEEYWNFFADLLASAPPGFRAKAVKLDGKKFQIRSQKEADQLLQELSSSSFQVVDVRRKERSKKPVPPFITSKLQQEASRKLRFSVKRTMMLAQQLYEGKEIGEEGAVGLITYMRTDSTRVADSALQEVRQWIDGSFGAGYLPPQPARYKSGKAAQDAHEAIRPTSVARTPESLKPYLDRDELRLYELIWKRFVASQMKPALFDQTEIDVEAGRTIFRAVGSILRFDGFLRVYRETLDETVEADMTEAEEEGRQLPDVSVGEILKIEKITPEQKFTQPPPRYTEATLVKALEEKGIGRPSTYAQILSVIQGRDYVNKEEQKFVPTATGEEVCDFLVQHFTDIFDYDYTARLEQDLDKIESGKQDWIETLESFYEGFSARLEQATKEAKDKPAGIQCDQCGADMVIRAGKFGRFIACSNFPKCKNTKEYAPEGQSETEPKEAVSAEPCEKCGKEMVLRKGRYGQFLACSGYPECKNTRKIGAAKASEEKKEVKLLDELCPRCQAPLALRSGRLGDFVACTAYPKCTYVQQKSTGVKCPECKKGEVVEKKSRRGKIFFGCDMYPKCKFVLWKRPVSETCPDCGSAYLLEKYSKKAGTSYVCANQECSYSRSVEEVPAEA